MAKRPLTEDAGVTQMKTRWPRWNREEEYSSPSNFSESELDAARQLVQLSGDSDDSTAASSSSSNVAASGAATRRVYYDRAEASSAHREFCPSAEDFDDSDENRGRTRRRKFGLIQRIYELTEPPSSASPGRAKKTINCR